jgi:hypothetical protein
MRDLLQVFRSQVCPHDPLLWNIRGINLWLNPRHKTVICLSDMNVWCTLVKLLAIEGNAGLAPMRPSQ